MPNINRPMYTGVWRCSDMTVRDVSEKGVKVSVRVNQVDIFSIKNQVYNNTG